MTRTIPVSEEADILHSICSQGDQSPSNNVLQGDLSLLLSSYSADKSIINMTWLFHFAHQYLKWLGSRKGITQREFLSLSLFPFRQWGAELAISISIKSVVEDPKRQGQFLGHETGGELWGGECSRIFSKEENKQGPRLCLEMWSRTRGLWFSQLFLLMMNLINAHISKIFLTLILSELCCSRILWVGLYQNDL